jgi:very-short-patch-repair endonuclease
MQLTDDQLRFARSLRRHQTNAESLIWYHLRGRRFMNLRFRRQHPIGPYFADFACLDLQLVIELDGGQHNEPTGIAYDTARTAFMTARGFVVLRFWDNDVLRTPMVVLGEIARAVQELKTRALPAALTRASRDLSHERER